MSNQCNAPGHDWKPWQIVLFTTALGVVTIFVMWLQLGAPAFGQAPEPPQKPPAILAEPIADAEPVAEAQAPPDRVEPAPATVYVLRNHYRVRITRIIDGDTFVADVLMDYDIALVNQTIRMTGYDAWESSKRRRSVTVTDEEVAKGKKAVRALEEMIDGRDVFICPSQKEPRDSYGRLLGIITVMTDDGLVDVGHALTMAGHDRNTL